MEYWTDEKKPSLSGGDSRASAVDQPAEPSHDRRPQARDILDQTFQLIGLLTLDGILIEVNRAALEFCGAREEETLGKPFWQTPWWSHSPQLQIRLQEAVKEAATGRCIRFEASHPRPDGTLHFIDFSLKPLCDKTGKAIYLIPEGHDISDHKKVERNLYKVRESLAFLLGERMMELEEINSSLNQEIASHLQTEAALKEAQEKAEQATNAKSKFLAWVSHEIRSPLNAIQGIAVLLESRVNGQESQRLVDGLRCSADHLSSIIGQILDLSKIETGALTLEEQVFDLASLAKEVQALCEVQAASKELIFNTHIDPWVPRALWGDPLRIRQILLNLVCNSIKFVRTGNITLEIGYLGESDGRHSLKFVVTDTGPGIPTDCLSTIFTPFTRANQDGTIEGTGLGLAITQELVKRMNGSIRVESTVGKGTTFTVFLSLREASPAEIPARPHSCPPPQAGRALVVDDVAINQEILALILKDQGWETVTTDSGEDALVRLKQDPHWDIVFMDITLPGMSGLEATRQIKREPALAGIPIIALTGHAMAEDKERFLAGGMDGYLAKPFQIKQLREEMNRVLGTAVDLDIDK